MFFMQHCCFSLKNTVVFVYFSHRYDRSLVSHASVLFFFWFDLQLTSAKYHFRFEKGLAIEQLKIFDFFLRFGQLQKTE